MGELTRRVARRSSRVRTDLPFLVLDSVFATAAYLAVLVLRFDGAVPATYWDQFRVFAPVALAVHLGSNWMWGLYGQMWRHAGVNEARRVALAGLSASALLLLISLVSPERMPLSVLVLGGFLTLAVIGTLRFQSRLFAFKRAGTTTTGLRIVIVGAGEAGAAIAREMLRAPESGLVPVAFLDDDLKKHTRSLLGIPVVGGTSDLPGVIERYRAHQVLLAVPSADGELVRTVAELAEQSGTPLRVLPPVNQLLNGEARVRDVRDLNIEDLLGRKPVQTDLDGVSELLRGRRVLITGAGGSIGSEIARQVAEFGPAQLILLDHDETHLHDAAAVLPTSAEQTLIDIRDPDELLAVFDQYRPQVVFHAAAHKHVPLLEAHPREAVRTNVLGTANVVRAAGAFSVEHLVVISTDKAVRPSSIMGASKWLAEQIVLTETTAGRRWCAVRFGNVLGSRGSVIPTFARQIAAGGPVTVTDPRMTRFFMSISEAVQLVLQASVLAEGGEVFLLEMGEPVNILQLAERMIHLSGRAVGTEVAVRFTGVRPGEKLSEELYLPVEAASPTSHPSIVRLSPRQLPAPVLDHFLGVFAGLVAARDDVAVTTQLRQIAASAWDNSVDLVLDLRDTASAPELWVRSTS